MEEDPGRQDARFWRRQTIAALPGTRRRLSAMPGMEDRRQEEHAKPASKRIVGAFVRMRARGAALFVWRGYCPFFDDSPAEACAP